LAKLPGLGLLVGVILLVIVGRFIVDDEMEVIEGELHFDYARRTSSVICREEVKLSKWGKKYK
jgi:hypothetical protein